jgi:hypothetical protein
MNQSTTGHKLICTICLWEGKGVEANWRALSPSHTWHNLCDLHADMYEHKYAQRHYVTDVLRAQLTAPADPDEKEVQP